GKRSPNALQEGQTYSLEWKSFGTFDANQAIHIIKNGANHSNYTYIHPLGTTAPAETGGGAYATGCKGIGCEEDIQISSDERHAYSGEPYKYVRAAGRGANVTYPKPKGENQQRDEDAWDKSYDSMALLRKVWRENKDKLQKSDNFELKIEPSPSQTNDDGNK
ncbi:MAG: hypothetical protein Q8K92_09090, partial [Leadbetterella sp.]|nr:hypothetical protein [Leadbetterella sp.]